MKRNMLVFVLLAWSGAGCVAWPHQAPSPAALGGMHAPPLPPGPITADLVESANAHRVADAVWDEMDRDQQKEPQPATAKDAKKR
jgi:hypothetical protein